MRIYIYTLSCPDTQAVRYVGKMRCTERRFYSHIRAPHLQLRTWISELRAQNKEPILTVLEETESDKSRKAEAKWINSFQEQGCALLNVKLIDRIGDGGMEYIGTYVPPNLKRKLQERAANEDRTLSVEVRRILTAAIYDRPLRWDEVEKQAEEQYASPIQTNQS